MRKIKRILFSLALMFAAFIVNAQQDSMFNYTYECEGCGNFKTVSLEPIELETEADLSTEVLPDTSTSTVVQFTNSLLRKSSPKQTTITKKNIFNVYPNPIKDKYFMYFESSEDTEIETRIVDLFGRNLFQNDLKLKKGVNVFANVIRNLKTGSYIIEARLKKEIFRKKILIEK